MHKYIDDNFASALLGAIITAIGAVLALSLVIEQRNRALEDLHKAETVLHESQNATKVCLAEREKAQ